MKWAFNSNINSFPNCLSVTRLCHCVPVWMCLTVGVCSDCIWWLRGFALLPSACLNPTVRRKGSKKQILSSLILILSAFNSLASYHQSPPPPHSTPPSSAPPLHLSLLPNFCHPLLRPWAGIKLTQSICATSSRLCCFSCGCSLLIKHLLPL